MGYRVQRGVLGIEQSAEFRPEDSVQSRDAEWGAEDDAEWGSWCKTHCRMRCTVQSRV